MKLQSIFLTACAVIVSTTLFSQNTNSGTTGQQNGQGIIHWKLDGNTATDNNFIGTVNEKPLIFKSNSLEGLRLLTDGNIKLEKLKLQPGDETYNLPRVMVVKEDGTLAIVQGDELFKLIAPPLDVDHYLGCTDPFGNPINTSPIWRSVASTSTFPAQLLSYNRCSDVNVGINVNKAEHSLHVKGNTFLDGNVIVTGTIAGTFSGNTNFNKLTVGNKKITSGAHTNYLFSVDGKAVFKEAIVTVDNWSDFVFNDDYKLKPLEEVELFIKNNKHLPDVPSEQKVLEEGIDLGEMDAILLQKIEELTLYMIELKKENTALKQEVEILKNK